MNRRIGTAVAAALSILATAPAWAGGSVNWSVSVHGGGYYPPPAYAVPQYYYPAPVYGPPVVAAPGPVYVYPGQVYPGPVIVGGGYYRHGHSPWHYGRPYYGPHYHGYGHYRR